VAFVIFLSACYLAVLKQDITQNLTRRQQRYRPLLPSSITLDQEVDGTLTRTLSTLVHRSQREQGQWGGEQNEACPARQATKVDRANSCAVIKQQTGDPEETCLNAANNLAESPPAPTKKNPHHNASMSCLWSATQQASRLQGGTAATSCRQRPTT
jgi:hypothetical protein